VGFWGGSLVFFVFVKVLSYLLFSLCGGGGIGASPLLSSFPLVFFFLGVWGGPWGSFWYWDLSFFFGSGESGCLF